MGSVMEVGRGKGKVAGLCQVFRQRCLKGPVFFLNSFLLVFEVKTRGRVETF